jgi:hypothetical protein
MANALTDAAKDRMLDSTAGSPAWPPSHMSLHTGDPSTTGANEVSGGSPAYARQPISWAAASGGSKSITGTEVFDVPAGSTIRYLGLFSAITAGTFFGYIPAQGAAVGARKQFSVPDTTADTLESPAHGFANNDTVIVFASVGAALPTGLSEGTVYFVVNQTTDDFQLSTTSGGGAINLTAIGDGEVQKIVPEVFASQGTYTVTAATISLPG